MRNAFIAAILACFACSANGQGTDSVTPICSFTFPVNGQSPSGGVIQGVDGYLYGTTQNGGIHNVGTIFKISPAGVETILYTFTGGADGANPKTSLTQGTDGNFYGTASAGGNGGGHGTVFKITPAGVFTLLYTFTDSAYDGGYPIAGLVLGKDGSFYGTTYGDGGGYGTVTDGTVFKITTAGILTTLHAFSGGAAGGYTGDGAYPSAGLTLGNDGNFYGTTYQGGGGYGTAFQITPAGVLKTVHTFSGGADGANPLAGFTLGKDGNFYGTTYQGGEVYNSGTVFKITLAGVLTPLYNFLNDIYGGTPEGGVTEGEDGNFYGTTYEGGVNNYGTVFQVTPAGVLTTLYNFTGGADGGYPTAALALGTDGNFYGTTSGSVRGPQGVVAANGTVFEITPGGIFKTLHTFSGGADGAYPLAALTLGKDGNFYGTASAGGDANNSGTVFPYSGGTIFKITPAGVFTHLYSFSINPIDGQYDVGYNPAAVLTQGKDGSFYGTTGAGGGANGAGTVFKITPAGVLTSLHAFTDAADGTYPNGASPSGSLALGTDGNFYGTTSGGGDGYYGGTVFKITPAGFFTHLDTFTYSDSDGGFPFGYDPLGGLTLGSDGNFYGTASAGGSSDDGGTIFEMTPSGSLTTLFDFLGSLAAAYPLSNLTLASDGNFYGTDVGGVFRLNVVQPAVTSATASGQINQIFSFQVAATSGPSTFAASNLPPGLSINAVTGLISGVPTQTGTFAVGLSVTNSVGTGTGMLGLTIYPATPVITSALAGAGQVAHLFSYQITAINSPTSFSASGLPSGLSVNSATGLISGHPLTSGTFNVIISAANAGGTGTATLVLTIKPAAPVITSVLTASGMVGQAFSYQITASNSPTSFAATNLPAGLSVNTSTGLISGTPTASGKFTVGLSATNSGGTGVAALTLTINPPAPVITSALSAAGQAGVAFSYQIAATNTPTSFAATNLPAGLSVNTTTGLISGTLTASGTFTVELSATNSGGTGTATLTLTIKQASPVITSALTASGQSGSAFSYQITASNSPTSFGATSLPAGLSVNTATGLISGTPTASGKFTVGLSATNSGGTGTATLTLTINPAIPVINSPLTATGQAGSAFSYQIAATNSPTSFAATGLPAGLSVNRTTGLITGTPAATGVSSVTLAAANAVGVGRATLTLTINQASPMITSALAATGQAAHLFSYQITASNSPTSFGASGLPSGLTVSSSTGLISGHPLTSGTYSVTLSATNPGGTGTATLILTINPQSPVITSVLTASGQAGQAFTYQITASNSPTSFAAINLPAGLSVNTTRGLISGTPTVSGKFSVGLSATNAGGTGNAILTLTLAASTQAGAVNP